MICPYFETVRKLFFFMLALQFVDEQLFQNTANNSDVMTLLEFDHNATLTSVAQRLAEFQVSKNDRENGTGAR